MVWWRICCACCGKDGYPETAPAAPQYFPSPPRAQELLRSLVTGCCGSELQAWGETKLAPEIRPTDVGVVWGCLEIWTLPYCFTIIFALKIALFGAFPISWQTHPLTDFMYIVPVPLAWDKPMAPSREPSGQRRCYRRLWVGRGFVGYLGTQNRITKDHQNWMDIWMVFRSQGWQVLWVHASPMCGHHGATLDSQLCSFSHQDPHEKPPTKLARYTSQQNRTYHQEHTHTLVITHTHTQLPNCRLGDLFSCVLIPGTLATQLLFDLHSYHHCVCSDFQGFLSFL